ncbi:sugar porter family MFS transporter [Oceanobacillus profundus]|uniref:sugar porter family MFS transporter n=1 Tax=Oceanobacillus profundus TaxID=372463 RepID=UPI0025598BF4|nr:sugar porter family MFS transporter [Oceanobacillus profundus]
MQNNSNFFIIRVALVASLGGLLFGYDTAVIAGAEQSVQLYLVDSLGFGSLVHGLTVSSALIGCIVGALFSGILSNNIGRRNTLIIAAILFAVSSFGSAYPELFFFTVGEPTVSLLITFNIYRIIGGIGVGLASAIAPVYISEMSPQHVRGRLVVMYNMAVVFGQTVVYIVNWLITLGRPGSWVHEIGWRYMFASEIVPAVLFFGLLFLIPESPRYLALKNKEKRALNVLEKLYGTKQAAYKTLENIKDTLRIQNENFNIFYYGKTVLIVGIAIAMLQQFIGINIILYYAPRIFESLGAGQSASMLQTVLVGLIGVVVSFIAMRYVDTYGRKFLLLIGSAGCAICLLAVATLFLSGIYGISTLIFILAFVAIFQMTWGPVTWVMLAEIFPNKIRGQAISIAVTLHWGANLAASSTFPPLNEAFGAGSFFIYGTISILAFFFVWKFVPETKNKSLEELENIWIKKNIEITIEKKDKVATGS